MNSRNLWVFLEKYTSLEKQSKSINIDILLIPVSELFSGSENTRIRMVLAVNDCEYLGDVIQLTEEKLLKCRNCGRLSLSRIKQKLSLYSLKLGLVLPPTIKQRMKDTISGKCNPK